MIPIELEKNPGAHPPTPFERGAYQALKLIMIGALLAIQILILAGAVSTVIEKWPIIGPRLEALGILPGN